MWIGWPLRFLRFLLWDSSGFISARQDEPVDAIHQFKLMEVDQEAYGDAQQFHVAEQLGLVNRHDLLDRFEFEQQAAFDQNVKAERLFEDKSLVLDFDNALVNSPSTRGGSIRGGRHFS